MNLGWQLRAGIRTQDCIPRAPPQSGVGCEGPFSCSSHGEGCRTGSKSTLPQQVPAHLRSPHLTGVYTPLSALERKSLNLPVF